jgi:hypothetical protein
LIVDERASQHRWNHPERWFCDHRKHFIWTEQILASVGPRFWATRPHLPCAIRGCVRSWRIAPGFHQKDEERPSNWDDVKKWLLLD